MLADVVRTDRRNHREVSADTDLAEAIKILARTHQSLVWSRQRQLNQLRSTLREFYPGALQAFGRDLASPEACTILAIASTPERGRRLTPAQISRSLRVSGRKRRLTQRATEIRDALRVSQLELPSVLAEAYGEAVRSLVALIDATSRLPEKVNFRR